MSTDWATVRWRDGLEIVDQTLLPRQLRMICLSTLAEVVDAIRRLAVRGAPAIGVCAAYGMVVAADEPGSDGDGPLPRLESAAGTLIAARPTAVNLRWGVERVLAAAHRAASAGADAREIRGQLLDEAHRIAEAERAACAEIGECGAQQLRELGARRILTHCNAGKLATVGAGTALAPIYTLAAAGEPVAVWATETRPLRQGARLTAWELADAGIPVTLLADSAAGALLAAGRIDAVVLGADCIAANGDTANKIGTYSLAVLAQRHGVPFYVAAPTSTVDLGTPSGAQIIVEERAGDELGRREIDRADVPVWNPAFDMTPAELVSAFFTEAGVVRPPYAARLAQLPASSMRKQRVT